VWWWLLPLLWYCWCIRCFDCCWWYCSVLLMITLFTFYHLLLHYSRWMYGVWYCY
jgi:hypothetical protein